MNGRRVLSTLFLLFSLVANVDAASTLPRLTFYETSVASDYGNGCEFEAVYTMKYTPFRRWRLADNYAYVLWQQSENGGRSWTNIDGQSGVNKDELRVMVEGTENLIFRAVVVSDATVESAKKNAEYIGEHGVPANADVKYTISKRLESMKPEATCEYDPDYLCMRYETFGMCSSGSCRYDTAVKVNKYRSGGTEKMTWGQYIICSNPDSAIYTRECEDCPKQFQFASVKDEEGNVIDSSATSKLLPLYSGDSFVFIMMSKDEYKKIPRLYSMFSGGRDLCPCKDYVFYTFISCVGEPTGTRIYPKITILNPANGDTLASQTFFYTYKGFGLNKPNLPFTPPSDYHNDGFLAIVELDYESTNAEGEKMSDYVTFSMDECAFSVCGLRVPSHGSNVDRKPFRILSNGFYCRMDNGRRVGQWNGFEEWRYRHPDAAFLWLRQNTPESPWVPLPEEKDTIFTYSWEEGERHATYKVILAENPEIIRQKVEEGTIHDPCAIRTEPYQLGFYCEEYRCPKTKFSFVEDDPKAIDLDTAILYYRTEDVEVVLYQNNSEPIDAFYIKESGLQVRSETVGRRHTLYLPAEKGTVTIYAMKDTCMTDSVFYTIDKVCPDTKFTFVEGDANATERDTTVYHYRTEDLEVVLYQNNSEPFDAFYAAGSDKPIRSVSSGRKHTLYLPAEKSSLTIYAMKDTCMTDSVFYTIDKVCPDTKFTFVEGDADATGRDTTVYHYRMEDLEVVLYQNNSEPFDAFYAAGSDKPIRSVSSGRKHTLYLPAEKSSLTIYAKSDTCKTDSVFYTIDKVCPDTKFTFVEGDADATGRDTTVYHYRTEDLEVVLYQNNSEPFDAFYAAGNDSPIRSVSSGRKHTLYLPAEKGSLTIYAKSDTCMTDSVFYTIDKVCPDTKFTFVEGDRNATERDTTVYHNRTEDLAVVLYQNNSEPFDAFYATGSDKPIRSVSSGRKHTLYLPAEKGSLTIYAKSDTCKTDSVFYTIDKVCPDTKFTFVEGDADATERDTTVYHYRTEDLAVVLYQNNSEPFDAFYAAGSDNPIRSVSSGRKHTLYLPAEKSSMTIYAKSDTCMTDSVFYTIDKVCPDTKFTFVEGDADATERDTTVYHYRTEDLEVVLYQNNSEPFDAFYAAGNDSPIRSVSSGRKHTLYLPAEKGSLTIYAKSDTCMTDSVFYTIDKVCPNTGFSFVDGDFAAKNTDTTVCYDHTGAVEVVLYQNNSEPFDALYIKGSGTPLLSKTTGNSHTLYLPAEEGTVTIYAMNDTCKTDSLFFSLSRHSELELDKIDDSGQREIVVDATGGVGNYSYDFGAGFQASNKLTDVKYGVKYKIRVMDGSGCVVDSLYQTNLYEIEVLPSFSPNGDGVNDTWVVKNIEKYPSARITLYDRTGKMLQSGTGEFFENWDGTYLGHPLPTTDYWYEISIDEIDRIYVGHFTLTR